MKYVEGDLIELALKGEFDVIIHGCNCWCTWGAGIARQMRDTFPEAFLVDRNTNKGDRGKLGKYLYVKVSDSLYVVNAYTQFGFGRDTHPNVSYDAIDSVFRKLSQSQLYEEAKNIGVPMIGAGLAGGDWEIISRLIDSHDKDKKITCVKYKPTKKGG